MSGLARRPQNHRKTPKQLFEMEKLLDEISFTATDRKGDTITIDAEYVRAQVSDLAKDADLSKFIL